MQESAHGDHAAFSSIRFALPDNDHPPSQIDLLPAQKTDFRIAKASLQRDDDTNLPDSRAAVAALIEERSFFFHTDDPPKLFRFRVGQFLSKYSPICITKRISIANKSLFCRSLARKPTIQSPVTNRAFM